jgi:hypothetical protein
VQKQVKSTSNNNTSKDGKQGEKISKRKDLSHLHRIGLGDIVRSEDEYEDDSTESDFVKQRKPKASNKTKRLGSSAGERLLGSNDSASSDDESTESKANYYAPAGKLSNKKSKHTNKHTAKGIVVERENKQGRHQQVKKTNKQKNGLMSSVTDKEDLLSASEDSAGSNDDDDEFVSKEYTSGAKPKHISKVSRVTNKQAKAKGKVMDNKQEKKKQGPSKMTNNRPVNNSNGCANSDNEPAEDSTAESNKVC